MDKFGNDTSTLTNTEQGMSTSANLLSSSKLDLLACFRQSYPGSCLNTFSRPCNVTEGYKRIMSQTDLASIHNYSTSDAYTSINYIHVTRLNAIYYYSNINHLNTVTDNLMTHRICDYRNTRTLWGNIIF